MSQQLNGLYSDVEELIQDINMGKPHVVILGAGASRQAFPEGDRNRESLPLMDDLVEIVGLNSTFKEQSINYEGKNFEDIFSDLYQTRSKTHLIEIIKRKIWEYFSRMELPSYPTLYDHLVLSLRRKDLIATFNWDPLLYYACWRNHKKTRLPHVVYLHGNVAIGYCLKDNTTGWINSKCSKCNKDFVPSDLLYPIKQKDYSQDPFIKTEWEVLKYTLGSAYMLTIFGYSAPQSDLEAIELMKSAWGDKYQRNIEQIEIIDVKDEKVLSDSWKDFIHTHHYDVTDNFYSSSIGLFPRRTCEAEWNYTMPIKPIFYPQNPIPKTLEFEELWRWYDPLIEVEKKRMN